MTDTSNAQLMRVSLPDAPKRIRRLPVDKRGFPVPWFVSWVNGEPEFRAFDSAKWITAVKQKRCWVCGERLGIHLAFVIGPMCAVTRTTSEPPCHRECAIWSARACPFLTRPRMRRNVKDLPEGYKDPAGIHIDRNPGVACIWMTRQYRVFKPHNGGDGRLITVGDPEDVLWFAEGRAWMRRAGDAVAAAGGGVMTATRLVPRPGFNPMLIQWGAPDQRRTDRCSYCGDHFPDEEHDADFVPLILWNEAGWVADPGRTREQHIEWCKVRAREYLSHGDLLNAVTSMMSDLGTHPETKCQGSSMALLFLGAGIAALNGDEALVRRFVEGFR